MGSTTAKDAWSDWKLFVAMIVLAYVWQLSLLARSGSLDLEGIVFGVWAPLLFIPLWAMWSSVRLLQRGLSRGRTWSTRVLAWRAVVGRLGITIGQLLLFTGLVCLGALWVFGRTVGIAGLVEVLPVPAVDWVVAFFVRGYLSVLLAVVILAAMAQFAYAFSRLAERFRTLTALWVFAVLGWVGVRLVPIFTDWLVWLPALSFDDIYAIGDAFEFRTVFVDSAPVAAAFVFLALVTVGSALVLDALKAGDTVALKEPAGEGVA